MLVLFGVGFLVANARIGLDYVRFLRRRRAALLTWPSPRPPYYGMALGIGVVLGLLFFYSALQFYSGLRRASPQVFGEGMMFLYYAYAMPLSRRIRRGFYEDGIWADSSFIPYNEVGGISWRESDQITLIVISRLRNLARRLSVPVGNYGAARRVLRDKIASHAIHFSGVGLDLGDHDAREDV